LRGGVADEAIDLFAYGTDENTRWYV
jgi:hypothetical protein